MTGASSSDCSRASTRRRMSSSTSVTNVFSRRPPASSRCACLHNLRRGAPRRMAENSSFCALSRAQVVLGLYIVRGDNMCVPRLDFFLFSHSLVLALVLDFAALLSHTPRPCARSQCPRRRDRRGGGRGARARRDCSRAAQAGRALTIETAARTPHRPRRATSRRALDQLLL